MKHSKRTNSAWIRGILGVVTLSLAVAVAGCGGSKNNPSAEEIDNIPDPIEERSGEEPVGNADPVMNLDEDVNAEAPSIDPDVIPPTVASVSPIDAWTIEISFSETVDFQSIADNESIEVLGLTRFGVIKMSGAVQRVGESDSETIRFVLDNPLAAAPAPDGRILSLFAYSVHVYGAFDMSAPDLVPEVNPARAVKDLAGNAMTRTFGQALRCNEDISCPVVNN